MEFSHKIRKTDTVAKKIKLFNEITDLILLRKLIYKTIEISYSAYYDEQVVQYFKDYHYNEEIRNRARKGSTFLYSLENRILGTGTLIENRIEAVFTDPSMHCRGIGKQIMYTLLHHADIQRYEKVTIESTPGSKSFFERLGFKQIYDLTIFVDDIYPVMHHIMEKKLR